jgi:uncharacterized protein YigA (DUF484 family)
MRALNAAHTLVLEELAKAAAQNSELCQQVVSLQAQLIKELREK